MTSSRRMWPLLVFLLVGVADPAAAQTYRWVDEQGNPHYAGRRDQVPERYRSQLPGEKPGEPPKPRLPSTRPSGITSKVTGECTLRVRGTGRLRSVVVLPELRSLLESSGPDARRGKSRAECNASSVESYK